MPRPLGSVVGASVLAALMVQGSAARADDKQVCLDAAEKAQQLKNAGKLYRACGNCSSSYQRHVVVDNVILDDVDYVVGINSNWGDTATLTRIVLYNGSNTVVCGKFKGVAKGSEPSYIGEGWNDANCKVSQSNVTRR